MVIKPPAVADDQTLRIGKVKVSWSVCSLSLSQLPEVCLRCQEFGHPNCAGDAKRSAIGHTAQKCKKPPKCMICGNIGYNNHLCGGPKRPTLKQAMSGKSQRR